MAFALNHDLEHAFKDDVDIVGVLVEVDFARPRIIVDNVEMNVDLMRTDLLVNELNAGTAAEIHRLHRRGVDVGEKRLAVGHTGTLLPVANWPKLAGWFDWCNRTGDAQCTYSVRPLARMIPSSSGPRAVPR